MLCRCKRFPWWQNCRSALRHTQQADALNCNETICQHRSLYHNDCVAGNLARENIFCSHRVPGGQKMRKDRELYSFYTTLQISLICQMLLFFIIQLPCLVYDTLPPGVMDLFHFQCFHVDTYTGFFFFFVFQFYIIHSVRSRVLYHSFSVNFDCYPFFLFSFFSIFHLSVKSTGGARAEKKRCVFWAVLAGCYNGRFKFGFYFSSGFCWKLTEKNERKESIKGSRIMNMW